MKGLHATLELFNLRHQSLVVSYPMVDGESVYLKDIHGEDTKKTKFFLIVEPGTVIKLLGIFRGPN